MKIGLSLACYPQTDETWSYIPPLGLGYLASYTNAFAGGAEFVVERRPADLIQHKPDFAGLTFVTFNYSYAVREARKIKDALGCPIICGGPHVSTMPEILDPVFDLAVLGEGEETFAELVRLWKDRGAFRPEDLRTIPGLLFHNEEGQLERSPKRELFKDLDRVPYPDRELLHQKWAMDGSLVSIMTSRGCPYNCSFCSTIHHWGRGFRCPSNEYVVREIEEIRTRFMPKEILIYDDLFVVDKKRVVDLCRMIHERGLHEGLEFRCFVRPNLLDDRVVEALASINNHVLNIGFESGSNEMLSRLNKRGCNIEVNHKALDLGRKYGVRYSSCFIMGIPGESREDILANFEFVMANTDVFDNVSFSPLQVLPSTEVWQWAKKIGVSENNMQGIVLEPDDFDGERDFLMNKWSYLNGDVIPLEEFYVYYMIGKRLEKMINEMTDLRKKAQQADAPPSMEYITSQIPFSSIIKEKARRRLRTLMPTEPSLIHNKS
ncbi:MAG: B12-binding domain-containing radical SAM protein [Candidatus Hinthialibacter sp.]